MDIADGYMLLSLLVGLFTEEEKKGGGGVKDNLSFKDICECALPIPQEHTHFFWKMIFAATLKNKPLVWWESIGKEIIYWSYGMWCVFPLIHCLSKQPIAGWIEYLSSRCFGQGGSALFFFIFLFLTAGSMTMKCANTERNGPARGPQPPNPLPALSREELSQREARVFESLEQNGCSDSENTWGCYSCLTSVCVCVIVNAFIYCGVFLSMFSANEWRL